MTAADEMFFIGAARYSVQVLVDLAKTVLQRLTAPETADVQLQLNALLTRADTLAPIELGARLLQRLASEKSIWIDIVVPALRSFAPHEIGAPEVVGIVGAGGPVYAVNATTGSELDDAVLNFVYRPSPNIPTVEMPRRRAALPSAPGGRASGPREYVTRGGGDSGREPPGAELRDGPSLTRSRVAAGSQPTVSTSRFLRADLPERASLDGEVSLLVRVMMQPGNGDETVDIDLVDIPTEGAMVHIVVNAPGLQTLDELEKDLVVPQSGDSPPVRFGFRSKVMGLHRVNLTAWRGGSFIGELELEISIEKNVSVVEGPARNVAIGLKSNPGEATLQVRFDPTSREYMFQLMSSDRLFDPVIESLAGLPDARVDALARNLSDFAAKRTSLEPGLAQSWMRDAGIGLWTSLVPRAIQEEFWQVRDTISSFTIASDSDVVPWELLYPLAPGNDAGFLIEQFPVMRRTYKQRRARALALGNAKFVVPPNSPSDATKEIAAVQHRFDRESDAPDPITKLSSLVATLNAADFGVLHFACHNSFDVTAGGSSVIMEGGPFEPLRLNSMVAQETFAERAPLVFFNACRSNGEVLEYTRLSGWASNFMASGVGAFIGTLWSVRSSSAAAFADHFYGALVEDGKTLGAASTEARAAIKTSDDPTWLAYTIYGDPNATVLEGVS